MYVKLVNGNKEYFVNPLIVSGKEIYNPTHDQLIEAGYEFEEIAEVTPEEVENFDS